MVGLIPSYGRLTARPFVRRMIQGALAGFIGILLSVLSRFAREALVDPWAVALMAAGWLALWRKVDLLWVVGVVATVSILVF